LAGLLQVASTDASGPPERARPPAADSTIVVESFDYPDQVGRFPDKWGGQEGWRRVKGKDMYYSLVSEEGNIFLRAETTGKAINAATHGNINLRVHNRLRWRWRVHSLPRGGNERMADTYDSAASVRLVFHGGVIPKVLTYVWSSTLPAGAETASPNTDKVQIVVLESGSAKAGQWVWEEVDAYADYKRLYGGEPRPVRFLAVLTDSDNTLSPAKADYDDFTFIKAPPDTVQMVPDYLEMK